MLLLGTQGIAGDVPRIHHRRQTPAPAPRAPGTALHCQSCHSRAVARCGVELVSTDAFLPSAPGVASGQEESTMHGRSRMPFGLPHPIQRSWRA